tara:strand:+ start:181 stop:384 length:204 start_codon:yes stop_codon:yes gene_type:complete
MKTLINYLNFYKMNYSSVTKKYTKIRTLKIRIKGQSARLMRSFGFSVKFIAKKLDVSPSRVYQYLKN